jgi:aryl-alcohol dehydrogenase-like predicted oxidoreductase
MVDVISPYRSLTIFRTAGAVSNALPASSGNTSEGRTPADNATVRTVSVVGPDKKVKLQLSYPILGWREIPDPTVHEIIRSAIDVGINFFDTSDMYGKGRAESLLGKALGADKNRVVVATKGGLLDRFLPGTSDFARDFSGAHLRKAVHESLKRLNREWIDLYQLHGPDLTVAQDNDTRRTLQDLVSEGKIRHFGVSLGSRISDLSVWTSWSVASIQAGTT